MSESHGDEHLIDVSHVKYKDHWDESAIGVITSMASTLADLIKPDQHLHAKAHQSKVAFYLGILRDMAIDRAQLAAEQEYIDSLNDGGCER
jgi:hypothetical protein